MIHEEIYHTCDRCGNKLKNDIIKFDRKKEIKILSVKTATERVEEVLKRAEMESCIREIKIEMKHFLQTDHIELCCDCRKAFEQFMKNEV